VVRAAELGLPGTSEERLANVVFATIQDRRGRSILSVRDQNTFDESLRRKRLMTLMQLFLIHRYQAAAILAHSDRGQPPAMREH
jgi:isocitrate lyase